MHMNSMETKTATGKMPLSDFLGILDKKEVDLLEKTIEKNRKIHKKLHEKITKRILGEFEDKLIIEGD